MGASFAFLASWSPWCRGLGRTWLGPLLHQSAKVAGKLVRAAFFHQSCRCPSRPRSPHVPLCLACANFVGACNCQQPELRWDHFACCFRCGPWLCSSLCQTLEGTLRSPSLNDHKLSHASGRIKSTAIIGFLPMPSWPRFLFKHSLLQVACILGPRMDVGKVWSPSFPGWARSPSSCLACAMPLWFR